jgi:hypothetical protein
MLDKRRQLAIINSRPRLRLVKEKIMSGFARIIESSNFIYLRFENIGQRAKFSSLMNFFNSEFQLKVWDPSRRAWQLPYFCREQLIAFCVSVFGPAKCLIEKDSNSSVEIM